MSDKKTGCTQALVALAICAACIYSTYTVAPWIWRWYFVPLGLPPITWRHVLGAIMLKAVVWGVKSPKGDLVGWDLAEKASGVLAMTWTAVALAYVFRP